MRGVRSSAFSRLAVVHAASSAGDALVTVALAGSVFASVSLHAARGRTAIGLVCTVVPFLVVGPLLGPAIDTMRGGRRAMIALSALGRVVACLLMAAWIHSLLLFPAAFFALVCSKTYLVAKASLVPSVVDTSEQLVEANAKLAVGSSIVTSLAGMLGAALYRSAGSDPVLYVDAVLLAACALLATRIPAGRSEAPAVAASRPSAAGARRRPAGPLRGPLGPGTRPAGRALVLSAALVASMRAAAGLVIALVIFGFRRESAPLIWYGLVGVASVGGHLGGAILAPAIRRRFGETRTVSGAAMAIGLVALGVTQVDSMGRRPAALVLATVIGLAASVAKLAFDAVVQRDAPSASRSRVFARLEATFQLVWVLGALVPVLIPMPLLVGFVLVATLTLAASAGYFAAMVGKRRHERPRWAPDATA